MALVVLMAAAAMGATLPAPALGAAQESLTDRWGIPGSPRGVRLAALFEAIAQGDDARFDAMVQEHFSARLRDAFGAEQHRERLRRLHERLGPDFEPAGLAMRSDSEVSVLLRGADGDEVRLVVGFDAGDGYRIAGLDIQVGGGGAGPALEAGSVDQLRALLERLAEENRFSGAVLVGTPEAIAFRHAVGLADRGTGTPNRLDTGFNIGSNTKDFTAAAILILAERGLLDLDDPLDRHLDGFPPDVGARVRIRHLLTHSAGWGHYWDHPEFQRRFTDLYELDDYLEFIRDIPLEFEPGTDEQYSNTGYEVLGAVIEAASGSSYADFVRREIFEPLGMHRTGNFPRDMPFEDRARGYTNDHPRGPAEGFLRDNTYLLPPRGTAAGGSFSTIGDLWRFWTAVLEGDLLSDRSRALFLNGFREDNPAPSAGESEWAGGGPGVRAYITVDHATHRVVVVLANVDGEVPRQVARAAADSPIGR